MGEESTIWPLQAHTRAKHELLRAYLDAYFPILAQGRNRAKRLLFLDGFAGPGVYAGGEPGSPIVAMQAIAAARVDLSRCEFVFLLVEEDQERATSLETQIAQFRSTHDLLPNLTIQIEARPFAEVAEQILDQLESAGARLAPTFAMIDPFGFGGAPMNLIQRLLAFPKCEVFFNFMLDSVNRQAGNDIVVDHMRGLFGTDAFSDVPPSGSPDRHQFLLDLFENQLRDKAQFEYVSKLALINRRGRPNVIFHGTRHRKGLEVMREALWKVDAIDGSRFDARDDAAGQEKLWGNEIDLEPLRQAIAERFAGLHTTVDEIENFVLLETHYKLTHIRREGLKVLENRGEIVKVVKADDSKRRKGSFPAGCLIQFA